MAYISMFHHRDGVSVAVIDEDATEYWKREDGHDPSDEEEYLTEGDLPPVYAAAPELLQALREAAAIVAHYTPFGGIYARFTDLIERIEGE